MPKLQVELSQSTHNSLRDTLTRMRGPGKPKPTTAQINTFAVLSTTPGREAELKALVESLKGPEASPLARMPGLVDALLSYALAKVQGLSPEQVRETLLPTPIQVITPTGEKMVTQARSKGGKHNPKK